MSRIITAKLKRNCIDGTWAAKSMIEICAMRRPFSKGHTNQGEEVRQVEDTCVAYDALIIVLKTNERTNERVTDCDESHVAQSSLRVVRRSGIVAAHCPAMIRVLLSAPSAFRSANPISSFVKANSSEIPPALSGPFDNERIRRVPEVISRRSFLITLMRPNNEFFFYLFHFRYD